MLGPAVVLTSSSSPIPQLLFCFRDVETGAERVGACPKSSPGLHAPRLGARRESGGRGGQAWRLWGVGVERRGSEKGG